MYFPTMVNINKQLVSIVNELPWKFVWFEMS